jgi:hypothetical protein
MIEMKKIKYLIIISLFFATLFGTIRPPIDSKSIENKTFMLIYEGVKKYIQFSNGNVFYIYPGTGEIEFRPNWIYFNKHSSIIFFIDGMFFIGKIDYLHNIIGSMEKDNFVYNFMAILKERWNDN